MKICYFVHDIGHPDLTRRFGMLRAGGAETIVIGFHRSRRVVDECAHAVIDLGATADAQFAQRIWAVISAVSRLRKWADRIASSKVILARNLEMLFLADIARRLYAPRAALVYECLDIHRLMVLRHPVSFALRNLEWYLLKRCQGLMVSSPAFIREYFCRISTRLPKVFVVENKIFLARGLPGEVTRVLPSGPPWRIGWFGILRCRRSLDILIRALRAIPGEIEVVTAGRPVPDVFPNFEKDIESIPGLTFVGPYKDDPADLAHLFGCVHFAWSIDFYEAATNSTWLLPNRLYRAALWGTVPLAAANVETGRWLQAHQAGILLEDPVEETLVDIIRSMTPTKFADARAGLRRIPKSALLADANECQGLVKELAKLHH
jgi:succinoglycan biosynthesis protein ExoL